MAASIFGLARRLSRRAIDKMRKGNAGGSLPNPPHVELTRERSEMAQKYHPEERLAEHFERFLEGSLKVIERVERGVPEALHRPPVEVVPRAENRVEIPRTVLVQTFDEVEPHRRGKARQCGEHQRQSHAVRELPPQELGDGQACPAEDEGEDDLPGVTREELEIRRGTVFTQHAKCRPKTFMHLGTIVNRHVREQERHAQPSHLPPLGRPRASLRPYDQQDRPKAVRPTKSVWVVPNQDARPSSRAMLVIRRKAPMSVRPP